MSIIVNWNESQLVASLIDLVTRSIGQYVVNKHRMCTLCPGRGASLQVRDAIWVLRCRRIKKGLSFHNFNQIAFQIHSLDLSKNVLFLSLIKLNYMNLSEHCYPAYLRFGSRWRTLSFGSARHCFALMPWPVQFMCTGLWHMPEKEKEMTRELAAFPFCFHPSRPFRAAALPVQTLLSSSPLRVTHTHEAPAKTRPAFRRGVGTAARR